MNERDRNDVSEKKSFSIFDLFLLIAAALAISLVVYFQVETPYGGSIAPAYTLTLRATLADWEEDLIPVERQRILSEDGAASGRVVAVTVISDGSDRILILNCEWEGDLPEGKTFRLETADLVKIMRITNVTEISRDTL